MKILKLAFFGYGVSDIPKSRKFYEGFLGLKSNDEFPAGDDKMFIEYDLPDGNTLVVGKADAWPPGGDVGTCAAFEVDNVAEWSEKAKKENIPVQTGPHTFPTCDMIVLFDPDKNRVCLHHKTHKAHS
jgi:predicted enzyme related to lactoylglutathione lyase